VLFECLRGSDSCQWCHLNRFLCSPFWYLDSLLGSVQVFVRGRSASLHVGPGRGRGPSRDVSRSQVCAAGIAHWFRCALFPAIAAHAARLVPRCPVDYIWTCHSGHDEEKERLRIFVWTVRKSLQQRLGIVPRMHCLYTVLNAVVLRLMSTTVEKNKLVRWLSDNEVVQTFHGVFRASVFSFYHNLLDPVVLTMCGYKTDVKKSSSSSLVSMLRTS
jgi:hypothetical protein